MRNKRRVLTALLSYGLLFCMSIQAQQVRKIYVNPQNPAIQKQSSFVDSIRFIPFESIKGVSIESSNVKPTENYYVVTDHRSRILYLYSKSGAFVKAVNYSSIGSNLYPSYRPNTNQFVFFGDNPNYTLTSKDRIKILLDWNNKRNLKYFRKYVLDLNDTSFTIRKSLPDNYDLTEAEMFSTDHYIQTKISTSKLYPDSIGYEVAIYADGKLVNRYFPYNRINEPRFLFGEQEVSASFSDTPYIAYLARPYCDTIYRLVKDSLYPAYQLVLPLDKSLPASFFSNPFKTKTEKENFQRNNGWVFHQVSNFYETPRLLYLGISFFMRFESFIYDKQTNTAYNVTKIKADPKQYNLSLLASFGFQSGNKHYTLLKADALISFFKQNPDVAVPAELALFLQNNPDKNTPVVVEYSLKN
jgi:hypothetical protein